MYDKEGADQHSATDLDRVHELVILNLSVPIDVQHDLEVEELSLCDIGQHLLEQVGEAIEVQVPKVTGVTAVKDIPEARLCGLQVVVEGREETLLIPLLLDPELTSGVLAANGLRSEVGEKDEESLQCLT